MDRIGKSLGLGEVGLARLPPQEIRVRGVGEAAGDRVFDAEAGADPEEPFRRALAAEERAVALVDIAGQQLRRLRVGAAQQYGRHTLDIGREARGVERADMLADRHQHLAAEMAAFFLGGELVLEMHAGRTRLDHRPHQLIGVERAAEAGLGIGDDRRHPISAVIAPLRRARSGRRGAARY